METMTLNPTAFAPLSQQELMEVDGGIFPYFIVGGIIILAGLAITVDGCNEVRTGEYQCQSCNSGNTATPDSTSVTQDSTQTIIN